ncbi:MAG: polysaccharide pyruvyl transferase family protein [Paludibacteraceae bacterium]|nr:polysaccharide pyruvyl transferase family protein [Paludibacteraceae bacterium]
MRIGILTFHRAHNYGAVLQCFALQQFLSYQGHTVKVIDYNKRKLWDYYSWYKAEEVRFALSNPRKVFKRGVKLLVKWHKRIPRYYKFVWFQNHWLKLCSPSEIVHLPFDLVLIGSDQVWNTKITHGFDPYYWGQFVRPYSTKVATFAASLRGEWEVQDRPIVQKYLQSLDAVSVREKSLAKVVARLFPLINPIVVSDPVFLLSAQEWKRFAIDPKSKTPYVFFYQAKDSETVYELSERIAQRVGKRLVVLSANVNGRNSEECRNASPLEFIGWIRNADLVLTSSFHATAFSIIFQKRFFSFDLMEGEDNRIKDLLLLFGLENRFICSTDEIDLSSFQEYDCSDSLKEFQNTAVHFVASLS